MKYCEDLLKRWDKRIQIEATLLFFFSVVTGSSFISIYMFWSVGDNVILYFLPFFYLITMFCWWHVCKRLAFNTEDSNYAAKWTYGVSFLFWQVITFSVSFGSWDNWGWNSNAGETHPSVDNIYRFVNCGLVSCFLLTLMFDYYKKIDDRRTRIRLWVSFIFVHSVFSLAYFGEWLSIERKEEQVGQWLAVLGAATLCLVTIVMFFAPLVHRFMLASLFLGLILYWWGSSSLDCDFYPDTADMTIMPGYQMLWTMAILVLLEALPTMASDIFVLGAEMLIDEDDDDMEFNANDAQGGGPPVTSAAALDIKA